MKGLLVVIFIAVLALTEARHSPASEKSEVMIIGRDDMPTAPERPIMPTQVVNIPVPLMELPPADHEQICEWKLHHFEEYSHGAAGWSNNECSECDCRKLLGGHCKFAGGEVHKEFEGFPTHNLLRIKANYWFLDNWAKETAFAKIEDKLVWTKGSVDATWRGINICGDSKFPDYINFPVDFVIKHTESCVKLAFGSNLSGDACLKSWGLSNVALYTCSHCADATYCPWEDQIIA